MSIRETREYLLDLGRRLKIKDNDFEAWYNVPYKTLESDQGGVGQGHLAKFDFSRYRMFSLAFPEHTWHPWLFPRSLNILDKIDDESRLRFGRYLEEKLGIQKPEEWYRITRADLAKIDHPRLFRSQAEMVQFLRDIYPDINWDPNRMAWTTLGFSHLHSTLQQLFPPDFVLRPAEYFPAHEPIRNIALINRYLVIPKSKLLFEYQGPIGFAKQILEGKENLTIVPPTDYLQGILAKERMTLIAIPFWWNREKGSLLNMIFQKRQDLFEESQVLAAYKDVALSALPIPESASVADLNLSDIYAQRYAVDPRFDHLNRKKAPKKSRKRKEMSPRVSRYVTKEQHDALMNAFLADRKLKAARRKQLAISLGLDEDKVKKWFQYRRKVERMKAKKLATEQGNESHASS